MYALVEIKGKQYKAEKDAVLGDVQSGRKGGCNDAHSYTVWLLEQDKGIIPWDEMHME